MKTTAEITQTIGVVNHNANGWYQADTTKAVFKIINIYKNYSKHVNKNDNT